MKTIIVLIVTFGWISLVYADTIGQARLFSAEYILELKEKQRAHLPKKARVTADTKKQGLKPTRHTGEIGAETYYFQYKEPGVMQEKGMFYGLNGAYTFRDKIMLRAEGRGAAGKVDYKNSGTLDNIVDFTLEFRGLAGYGFDIFTTSLVTPYFGAGYRYLNDDTKGKITSTGAVGYERESNYFYSPIGIEALTELNHELSWGLRVEYDYFWKGVQKSHLRDASPAFNDLENDQNKGYGVRGSAKLLLKSETIDFAIEPFVRYWNIKKSEDAKVTFTGVIVGTGFEPKNNTTEVGVKAALDF